MKLAQIKSPDPGARKTFRPSRYWISGKIQSQLSRVRQLLLIISPGIFSTAEFGNQLTIHVSSVDEVVQFYGSNYYMVTPQYLEQLVAKKMDYFYLFPTARQRISLCLYDIHIAITGVDSQEFLNLYSKVVLNSGIPVHPSNLELMDIFVSTKMLDKYVLKAANAGKPVVSPDYITVSYATQKTPKIEDYSIHVFTGLTFCSSDLDDQVVKKVKNLVKLGKGVWSECLDSNVDFLIAERLTLTKKILISLQANIPILSTKWIEDAMVKPVSIHDYTLNFWINEDSFDIFQGKTFSLNEKLENQGTLIEAIRASGGRFGPNPDFLIVPNFTEHHAPNMRTVQWLLDSISNKKMLDQDLSLAYIPFPNYAQKRVDLTGVEFILYKLPQDVKFKTIDILRAFGAVVKLRISGKAQYIITPSSDFKCADKQQKYGTKIFPPLWAVELAKTGQIPTKIVQSTNKELDELVNIIKNARAPPRKDGTVLKSQVVDFSDNDEPESNEGDVIYLVSGDHSTTKRGKRDELLELLENSEI